MPISGRSSGPGLDGQTRRSAWQTWRIRRHSAVVGPHNPFLMSDGIGFDPKSITAERLREEAWRTGEHLLKVGPVPSSTAETAMKQNHNGKEPGT